MIIQELFTRLGVKVDRGSFKRAKDELAGLEGAVRGADGRLRDAKGRFLSEGTAGGGKKNRGGFTLGNFGLGKFSSELKNYAAGYLGFQAARTVVNDVLDFDAALTDTIISSQHTVGSLGELRERILEVSNSTGIAKEQVLGLAHEFIVVTGDGKAAMESLEQFTRVAFASGAATEDVARTAGALSQQLNISSQDMESAFSIISEAGKRGKVELRDFATLFASTGATFKQFSGSQSREGLASVASSLQFVAQNFGTASEAATGLNQLMLNLTKLSTVNKMAAAGVQIYEVDANGVERLRSFSDIVADIAASPLADKTTLLQEALGGRANAYLALKALIDNKDAWLSMTGAIKDANSITKDFDERQQSSSAKARRAFNRLKNDIAEAFTPDRVQKLVKIIEKMVDVLGFVIDHLKEILLTWGAIKVAQLASAQAAAAAAAANAAAGAGGAAGAAGGASGAGTAAGAAGGAAAASKLSWVMPALAAGIGGFAVGSWFDKATNLSGLLSGTTGSEGKNAAWFEQQRARLISKTLSDMEAKAAADKLKQEAVYRQVYGNPNGPEKPTTVNNWGGIVVNSNASDPKEVAKHVKAEIDNHVRQAAAAAGVR